MSLNHTKKAVWPETPVTKPPNGETAPVRPWNVAPTSIQLALARGHRWLAMLESWEVKSLKEIAAREGIDNSYVSRMVNPTTLAPAIVAAIFDDALPNHITLFDLAVDPPGLWGEQRERVGLASIEGRPNRLAKGVAIEVGVLRQCRPMRDVEPQVEQQRAFQQELVGMGRDTKPVQQPLKGVAGQDQIEVLPGLAGAGEQASPHRSSRVALAHDRLSM